MKVRRRQAISWRQRSLDWVPQERYSIASKVRMFVEDLRLYIVPYSVGEEEGRNQIRVAGGSDGARDQVAVLFDAEGHRDVDDYVDRFIRDLMWPLAHEGRAIYEIVAGTLEGREDSDLYRLKRLPPGPVIRAGSSYLQFIPPRVRQSGQRWVRIPSNDMWDVRLPSSLGSPRRQKHLIRKLRQLSSPAPQFAIADLQRAGRIGYDVQTYWRESEMATARVTRGWGWPSRWAWRDFSTEYFQFYREACFRRSIALLLHDVVAQLNVLVAKLQIDATIEIDNPVTADDIETGLARLEAGEWEFARVRKEYLV